MSTTQVLKGSIISVSALVATLAFASTTFAATSLDIPSQCTGASPVLTVTQQITEGDTGRHGNWANDTFTETANVYPVTDVNDTVDGYCAVGTINSGGTFTTTGPLSPEKGVSIDAGITGSITGGETWLIPTSTPILVSGPNYTATTVNTTGDSQFKNWQTEVFGNTFSANTFTFTYVTDADASITWLDDGAGDAGDITNPAMSTVYVDANTGSDSNIGSQAYPFQTIQAAVNAVTSGGTVNVNAGTYTGDLAISNGVTLTGAGAPTTEIDGQITVNAANTTISGFTISNPDGNFGVLVNAVGDVNVSQNKISDIASGSPSQQINSYGIYYQSHSTGDVSDLTFDDNTINNVGGGITGKSNGAIAVGDSSGSGVVDTVEINGNAIANISGSTKGAYGILINHGASSGGSVTHLTIDGNSISNLTGGWAHAIGLEGDTPNAVVTNNAISDLTASGGDAAAVHFDDNADSASVEISNNTFDTTTVAFGVTSSVATDVNASPNFWNNGNTDPSSATASSGGTINVSPWFKDASMTALNSILDTTNPDAPTTMTGSTDTNLSGTNDNITVTVDIPANTTITADSAAWNGTIEAPTATGVNLSIPGFTTSVVTAIQIGTPDTDLTFDNAVRLVFAGQAGKQIGWFNASGDFTEITADCAATGGDDQSAQTAQLAAGGSCKMDSGSNLVVWTKHFSAFVVYTSVATGGGGSSSSSGGGGGGNGPVASGGGGGSTATALPNNGGAPSTGSTGTTGTVTTGGGQVLGAAAYNFATNLTVGSTGADVTALQQILIADGYLQIDAPTGYFGPLTKAAVMKYQTANDLPSTGYVGPLTRAVLNQGTTPTSSDEQKSLLLQSLQQQLQALLAQIAALTGGSASSTGQ